MQQFQSQGSGWVYVKTELWHLHVYKYQPLSASSYIPTPKDIDLTKAVVNIKNHDPKCFLWSVLAHLHPQAYSAWRVNNYTQYENELDMSGIQYPVKLSDISKFEELNCISVNVFGVEYNNMIYPMRITPERQYSQHVNLLFLKKANNTHYCLIRDFNRLLAYTTKYGGKSYFCYYCLQRFSQQRLLDRHVEYCSKFKCQRVEMPVNKDLRFVNHRFQLKVPFTVYADFECFIRAGDSNEHIPSGFAIVVVNDKSEMIYEFLYSSGDDDIVKTFYKTLFQMHSQIIAPQMKINKPLTMSHDDDVNYMSATHCHICGKEVLEGDKVRDHDHLTGLYRGAAHNSCNLSFKVSKKVPVIFHGLRSYDAHLLMQAVPQHSRINCIAKDMEKYITFSIDYFQFLDSYNFLADSLDNLTSYMTDFRFETNPMLLRKGVYPYEHVQSRQVFAETTLPPKEKFYSKLKGEHVSDRDYEHAQKVWSTFNIKNMQEYHDLYLRTDTRLLADVFEAFRDLCMQDYGLDPCHVYSLPGFTWQAALKKTGVVLELLQDIDMYLFVESGIRGGISMISTRYSKANNKYMREYDPKQESKYIIYLDCNSLYSTVMCDVLPVSDFEWVSPQTYLDNTNSEHGFILEVDLAYDKSLHDLHSDYPLAPERMGKLVPNLNDKTKYVLHYKTLLAYEQLGLRVTKYHRVLQFRQRAWMKPYIEFNINKRQQARNKFEVKFYKDLCNALFGKTMESVRKYKDIQIVPQSRLTKYANKSRFEGSREFHNDMHIVHMSRLKIVLNKPIYTGMSILDLSKVIMYNFHYGYMSKFDRKKLLGTDTDSLMYEIVTDDFYKEIAGDAAQHFDTSDYSKSHFLYSVVNKKKMGVMKDETCGIPILEFVGLLPKLYSFIVENEATGEIVEKKVAKGVDKATNKHTLTHWLYLECLRTKQEITGEVTRIVSKQHRLTTVTSTKVMLSCYDDKRYILENGIDTLAWGHYKINL